MHDDSEVPRRRSLKVTLQQALIPVGKIVFANRLLLGLFVVAIAAFFVRPTYSGSAKEYIVKGISIILVIAGVILRAWAAGRVSSFNDAFEAQPLSFNARGDRRR